jgi:hypothetical protein
MYEIINKHVIDSHVQGVGGELEGCVTLVS